MKPSIILEQRLYETKMYSRLIAGMDPKTAGYMQKVRENFTLPFIASLNNISTLMEAEMTTDQVTQAFGYAEKIATAGGDNRSMLGKGADAAGAIGAGAVDLAKTGAAGVKELANKLLAQNKDKLVQSLPPADAGPVEGFEQKAQEQIAQVQDPKAKQSLMDLVKQAAKNPAVQTMVLAAVGGIATVVAGPAIAGLGLGMAVTGALTGTVVGGLTGAVRGLMQGEGLKGALKQGAMGAGLGAVGGGVAGAVAQGAQAYMQNKNQQLPAADQAQNDAADAKAAGEWAKADPAERARIEQTTGMTPEQLQAKIPADTSQGRGISQGQELPDGSTVDSLNKNGSVTIKRPDGSTMIADRETAMAMANPGKGQFGGPAPADGGGSVSDQMSQYMAANKGKTLNDMGEWVDKPTVAQANQSAPAIPAQAQNTTDSDFSQAEINAPIKPSAAAEQLASQEAAKYGRVRPNLDDWRAANMLAKGQTAQTQSRVNTGKPLNEYVDYELTARMWYIRESVGKPRGNIHLTEAGIGDMFKKAGNWLKTKAGNVTNKVTADKLQQAWKKAGNPTDSGQVAGIMVSAGVPQETVDQIFQNLGLPTGASTVTAAPEAPAKAPGQGLLGRAAGAIGGAIGGVKGAIAGTKDAFAKGQETGFDSARTSQAGDAVGATGEANPYAKQDAQPGQEPQTQGTPQGQQPSYGQGAAPQAYGVAPRSTPGAQGQAAPATAQGTTDTGNDVTTADRRTSNYQKSLDNMGSAINKGGTAVADTVNDLNRAVQSGKGMGASGQSLVRGPYAPGGEGAGRDAVKIKDEYGQEHAYKKVGAKWFDAENKEVPAAIAAMLNKQAEQQAALTKAKTPAAQTAQEPAATTAPAAPAKAEPMSIGGQKLDPKDPASARMIAQVQQAQGGTQQPAGQTAPATGATTPDLGKQSDGKPIKPGQKFDTETGKPLAQQPGATPPATAATPPAQTPASTPPAQTPASTPPAQTPATTAATPPAATTAPASQSPEDIRKAKQADAAKAAQAQMAASTQQAQTASNDVMNRMTKQLGTPPAGGPAQTTPNFGKQMTGYGKTTTNAPTGVPAVAKPAVPATTNATTQPAQPEPQGTVLDLDQYKKDQAAKQAQTTQPAKPGFLQTATDKIAAKKAAPEPMVTAGIDFSAVLLRKMKQRV